MGACGIERHGMIRLHDNGDGRKMTDAERYAEQCGAKIKIGYSAAKEKISHELYATTAPITDANYVSGDFANNGADFSGSGGDFGGGGASGDWS